ncbi:DUF397 domain-containing protein [Nocardiopsis sp. NPDC058631]|uniref:DUF397 domain-containing protein n=1 Tax=Nocardiopsis sp. NPDC058631 TaxID=3346566 RepID=UPI00365E3011
MGRSANGSSAALFRKSSHSQPNQGECLEVADLPGAHAVRDTRNRRAGPLLFVSAEWYALLTALRAGWPGGTDRG